MVFVRLGGCNLRCSFCDTPYALDAEIQMEEEDIAGRVMQYSCRRVCITGGEPFLQDLRPLLEALKKNGCWVGAETNGTIWQDVSFDWLTVSPKREGTRIYDRGYDPRFIGEAKEFKYVITCESDFDFIDPAIRKPVILQPVDNDLSIAGIIERYLKQGAGENLYLRLQNHKVMGIR